MSWGFQNIWVIILKFSVKEKTCLCADKRIWHGVCPLPSLADHPLNQVSFISVLLRSVAVICLLFIRCCSRWSADVRWVDPCCRSGQTFPTASMATYARICVVHRVDKCVSVIYFVWNENFSPFPATDLKKQPVVGWPWHRVFCVLVAKKKSTLFLILGEHHRCLCNILSLLHKKSFTDYVILFMWSCVSPRNKASTRWRIFQRLCMNTLALEPFHFCH